MIDYRAAEAVLMVVRTGSFEKAARVLNVTPSAISQRVKQLEQRLGAALVVRGNPCKATDRGEILLRHVERISLLEEELVAHLPELVGPDCPEQVSISIAANPEMVGSWFLAALSSFTQHSGCLVNLVVADGYHARERLRSGDVFAAITIGDETVKGHHTIPIGSLHYIATAAPSYVSRHFSGGLTPDTITAAPVLALSETDTLPLDWIRLAVGHEVSYSAHTIPSSQAMLEAALTGMGWGLLPQHLAKSHLASGRLIELIPGLPLILPLFWQFSRLTVRQLSYLTDEIVAASERELR